MKQQRSSFRVVRRFWVVVDHPNALKSCARYDEVVLFFVRVCSFDIWGLFSPKYKIPGEKKVVFNTLNKRDTGFQNPKQKPTEKKEEKKAAGCVGLFDPHIIFRFVFEETDALCV